jgi:hypothetical protein
MFNSQQRRVNLEKADASTMKISIELLCEVQTADVTCQWQCLWTVKDTKGQYSTVPAARKTGKMAHDCTAQAHTVWCADRLWASKVVRGSETPIVCCSYCDLWRGHEGNGEASWFVLLTNRSDDQMKQNETDGACDTCREQKRCTEFWYKKPLGKTQK